MELTLFLVIALALVFDFTNGFHDTPNSIATLVGTRAMPPQAAVAFAAVLNFIGAFIGSEVAATVGKGIIDPEVATLNLVMAALVGAIGWNLTTWYVGIPSSSSHALIGGLVGAALASTSPIFWSGIMEKVAIPSVMAPLAGVLVAGLLTAILMRVFKNTNPARTNKLFRRAQILSGGWLSLTHGQNDAQKTMGIIGMALLISNGGDADSFDIPLWVTFSAATAMALGTYAGGWRIIKTLGGKVVKMEPMQGFAASAGAAGILFTAGMVGAPVSTTHCVTGCVMGAGASKRLSSVRWGLAGDIVTAWIFTLPAAALVGAVAYALISISPLALIAAVVGGAFLLRGQVEQRRARTLDEAFQTH